MKTENTMAVGVVKNNLMTKLKSMGMKFHWLRCQKNQRQYRHFGAPGTKKKEIIWKITYRELPRIH